MILSENIVTALYIAASVLFILSLGGLSGQESAKRAVWYGIVGMAMQFPSDEIGKIIADAQGGIQRATGILEDKARGYRADAEANQALLGLIPAGITA